MKTALFSGATLVFDLDGTLVDTAPDLVGTLNHILGELALPAVTAEQFRPFISFGARRMLVEGLRLAGETRNDGQLDGLLEQFLDHYGNNVAVESAPYPNVVDVLDAAREAGARLGVCTNKREGLSRSLLRELHLLDRFDAILGRDTLDVCKPDPRHLTETIARAGGRADRAIMIGDSAADVAAAKAASVPVVVVSFGYSETPAHALGADAVIDDYTELAALLPGLLKGNPA
ncbi:phosphoglycolate phosphatase [bacterium BMS3Bbin10]|nr:phosphoglycolate phosphatase [bacterium BMS3Bbin10]